MKTKILVLAAAGALAFCLFTTNGFAHQGGRRTGPQNSTSAQLRDGSGNQQGQGRGMGQYRNGEGRGMGWHRDGTGDRAGNRTRQRDGSCEK